MLGGAFPTEGEDAVDAQLRAGLEPVTDGRETVPTDARALSALVDDLRAGRGSAAVAAWKRAVARMAATAPGETRAVAATLPGPWSLAAAGPDLAVRARRVRAIGLAEALGAEAALLRDAGCALVRVDEPRALDLAAGADVVAAFTEAHAALCRVAGAGRAGGPHLMLALTGGTHEAAGARTLTDLAYASFLFDLVHGPDDWRLIAALPAERGVVCGVVDAATTIGDAPEILVWAAHYAASTAGRGLDRVGLSTTGTLAGLDPDAAARKLEALAEGARIAVLPREEMAASLDPRALDLRSAAIGGWAPDPRFDPRRR